MTDKPRCETCRWWERPGSKVAGREYGECKYDLEPRYIASHMEIYFTASFGCIFHEERE